MQARERQVNRSTGRATSLEIDVLHISLPDPLNGGLSILVSGRLPPGRHFPGLLLDKVRFDLYNTDIYYPKRRITWNPDD